MIKFYYLLLLSLCISFVYAQPPNDQCVDAQLLTNGAVFSGDSTGSTTTGFETCEPGVDRDFPVFFSYTTAINNGAISILTAGSSYDTELSVYDVCGGTCLAFNDDLDGFAGTTSEIYFTNVPVGTDYIIALTGISDTTGSYDILLTETAPPANDECVDATVLTENVLSSGSNFGSLTTGLTNCNGDTRDSPVFFSYTSGGNGLVAIDTSGSDFDTELSVYDACNGNCIAFNDDGGTGSDSLIIIGDAGAGVEYIIAITGFNSAFGDYDIIVTEQATAANDECSEAFELSNGSTFTGDTTNSEIISFIDCSGNTRTRAAFFTFTFPENSEVIISTVGSTLDTQLSVYDACNGNCIAFNDDGGPGSTSLITLVGFPGGQITIVLAGVLDTTGAYDITATSTPSNDECGDAIPLTNGVSEFGNNEDSVTVLSNCNLDSRDFPVFFTYTTTMANSFITIDTEGSDFDTELSVFSGICTTSCLAFNNNGGSGLLSLIALTDIGPAGTQITIVITGASSDTGNYQITLNEVPSLDNDKCSDAFELSNGVSITGTNSNSETLNFENCNSETKDFPVFFTYTTTIPNSFVVVNTSGSIIDTQLSIYDSCDGNCIAFNEDGGTGSASLVTLGPVTSVGTQFVIVITEFFSAQGPYQIIVTENIQPPSHPNDICSEAIALSNEVTFFGNSENSQTLDYTTCEPRDRDHPVFFSYTSTMEESLIAIFSSGEFDTEISVLTGCTGTCISFGFGSVGIFNVGPIGTQIIIVLTQGSGPSDANGAYSITVFESVGSSNSLCDNAIKLSTDIPYFDTNTNSPTQDTNCNSASRNSVVYYEYTTLGDDVVEITTDGSDFDTELSVFDACGGTCLGFDDDGIASSGPSLLIFNGLPAGTDLIIMVSGFDSETGNIEITAFEYPVINGNIDCDSAFILTNNTAVSDTQEAGIPFTNCISSTATNYAVFNYTTQLTNGEVIIDTCDSNSDTEISVFSDCSLTTCTGFNDDAFSPRCSGSPSVIEFNTLPVGTTLIIYVNDFTDIVRQFNIRVTESIPIPPTNANCSTAETLATGIPFFGDNLDSETSILNCDGNMRNTAVFFEYTSTLSDPNSVLSISTCGSVIDTEISVFDACGGSCVFNGFNDNGFSSSICDADSFVNLFAVPFNTTFIIVLTEVSDAEGPYTIVVNEFIRINDQCATVIPLTAGVLQSGSNRNSIATDDNLCGTTYDFSVGYSFTTQIDQAFIVIEITDNNFQVDITLLSGGCSGCITSASDLLEFSSPDPSGTLYDIIIANSNGDVGEFSITVHEFSPPSNDECSDATTLVNNVPIIGSNFASATLGFTTCSPDIRDFAVFYTYTTQFDFSGVTIETFGSAMNTELSVFDSCGGNCLAFNDDTTTGSDSLVVLNELNIGTTLIIAVTGFNSDFGKFNLLLSENPLPSNYKCTTPRLLFNGGSLQGTTEFSTSFWDLDLPDCTPDFPAHSPVVFYSYTSVFSFGNITVDTCGSGTLDTYIELFTGSCSSLTCLASGNNDFCGTKSSLTLNEAQRVDIGTNIIIAVHSPDTRDGTFTIIVNEEEVFEPVNDDCNLAIPLVNHVILESNTEDSETLRNSLPSCGTPVSSNNSPATFYSYTTQFQYGSIEISTCDGSKFDTYISLFTGSCGALSCIAENDDACGPSSIINVPFENRQPQGTVLYIVVAGKPGDIEGGEFTIVLHENGFPQPPNSACSNAITLFNDDAAAGTTLGSGTLSGQIPNCGSLSTESPTVFYTYTTQSTDSDLTISTCLGGDFDTIISVYTGSCSGLQCVADNDDSSSCGLLSEVSLSSLPAGTQLFIAVTGKPLNAGEFVLQVFEDDVCSLDPPEYQCTTSFSVLTDHKCGNNIQCATIPDYSIGSCFDKEGCSCTTTQTSTDVFPNDEKVAGRYTVTSIGTNAAGVQTDECSFGITVVDSCFANGPKIQCSNDVTFTTSPECSIAPNQHCTRLPPIFLASCSDNTPYCNCVVNQVSGAEPGDLLISGIYPITVEGTNDAGYTSQCSFNVIIE